MAKSPSKGWIAVTTATKALATQDQAARAEADREREQTQRGVIPLADVRARPHGDTRKVDANHVLELAESISVLGLLEPLVVDRHLHLLAGAHRWEASKLLALEDPDARAVYWGSIAGIQELKELKDEELLERVDRVKALTPWPAPAQVPVRIIDFDSEMDADRALSIEVAENEKRRDYTKPEVAALAERLKSAGFKVSRGKPKVGERALGPALAVIIGKSERTVRRLLGADHEQEDAKDDVNPTEAALRRVLSSIAHLEKTSVEKSGKKHRSLVEAAVKLGKQIEKALE